MAKVKCVDNKGNDWLTTGETYDVVGGEIGNGFFVKDDQNDSIFQFRIDGEHALFEVVE